MEKKEKYTKEDIGREERLLQKYKDTESAIPKLKSLAYLLRDVEEETQITVRHNSGDLKDTIEIGIIDSQYIRVKYDKDIPYFVISVGNYQKITKSSANQSEEGEVIIEHDAEIFIGEEKVKEQIEKYQKGEI